MTDTRGPRATVRDRLVVEATRLFSADGFAGTSLSRTAAAAGCSVGAIHFHFGDKRGLFRECYREAWRVLPASILRDGETASERVVRIVDAASADRYLPRLASQAVEALGAAGAVSIERELCGPALGSNDEVAARLVSTLIRDLTSSTKTESGDRVIRALVDGLSNRQRTTDAGVR
ncbi:TetR/AcrR family transcriptional regulator [Gordonia spumicola]|nr:TetR/AcrR family transcriptional regulator [Gordonia spumicola]